MNFFSLFISLLFLGQCSAVFECYCNTGHPRYPIYDCPSESADVIGLIDLPQQVVVYHDLNEPYCKPSLNMITPDGWISVYHYHQVGYMRLDAGFQKNLCPGLVMFNVATLKTSPNCQHKHPGAPGLVIGAPPTSLPNRPVVPAIGSTSGPQTTKSFSWVNVPAGSRCDSVILSQTIAQKQTIFNSDSRHCQNQAYATEEGVVIALCAAPPVTMWSKGARVMDNCASIAKNTPISVFLGNALPSGDSSGIFIECTSNSIKIARQVCSIGHVEVVEVPPFIANLIHVVDWM